MNNTIQTPKSQKYKHVIENANTILTIISIVVTLVSIIGGIKVLSDKIAVINSSINEINNTLAVYNSSFNEINNQFAGYNSSINENTNTLKLISSNITNIEQSVEQIQTINIYNTSTVQADGNQSFDNDYFSLAKSGDASARLLLAEHYISIGNYNDSIYWYKVFIDQNGPNVSSDELSIAYNNLGWLYVNGYGLVELDVFAPERYQQAFLCFKKASDLGSEIGTHNAIETITLPNFMHVSDDSDEINTFLSEHGITIDHNNHDNSAIVTSRYFSLPMYKGYTYTYHNYHCTYTGSYTAINGDTTQTEYAYYGVIYSSDGQVENCKFAYFG